MNVLHVTQGYAPGIGGTELVIQRVSEELVRRHDDRVTVFTTNCFNGEAFFNPGLPRMNAGWEGLNGVRVRRFAVSSRISQRCRGPQSLAYRLRLPFNQYLRALASGPIVPGLRRAIAEWPGDVIAASSFPLLHMFSALRAATETGRPCVLIGGLHPDDPWGFERPMIYEAIRRSVYIAYTPFEADYVIRRGALAERVFVTGVGVDLERYQTVSPATAKRDLGVADRPVVGFIGQLGGHKGVDTLLDAMPRIWCEIPETHLLLAGARALFTGRIDEIIGQWPPAWRDRVRLCLDFPEEEKPGLFAAVDVFAYPSGYESFGIAFLDYDVELERSLPCTRPRFDGDIKIYQRVVPFPDEHLF